MNLYFGFPEPSSLLQLFVSFDPIFFLSYLGVSFASCSLFTCRKDGSPEESERQGIWQKLFRNTQIRIICGRLPGKF